MTTKQIQAMEPALSALVRDWCGGDDVDLRHLDPLHAVRRAIGDPIWRAIDFAAQIEDHRDDGADAMMDRLIKLAGSELARYQPDPDKQRDAAMEMR